jgi:hypothetical protein
MKKCIICRKKKDESEFLSNKRCADKLSRECSKCFDVLLRERNGTSKHYHTKVKIDPIEKFRYQCKTFVSKSFSRACKGVYKKPEKSEILLGCTLDEFVIHLESKFQEGMTISNHGKWHIDHIIPISSAKTIEDIIKLTHYTNLQPLWAKDNLKKSNKIIIKL